MKESQEIRPELLDVEKEDFLRLCEFAYRGEYTMPPVISAKEYEKEVHHKHDEEEETQRQRRTAIRLERLDEDEETGLCKRVLQRVYCSEPSPYDKISRGFYTSLNQYRDTDLTPSLLAHAQLYRIANRYLVLDLKDLVLDKLRDELHRFSYWKYGCDLVKLVRFTYSNDNTPDKVGYESLDELRRLVVENVVLGVDTSITFEKSEELAELLKEGGQFVSDLWSISRREMRRRERENED